MEIVVGSTADAQKVGLREEQFRRGGYIVGLSGTGKSTLMANLFLQVIGQSNARHGAILLDPAGDLVKDVVKRIPESRREDVIYVDPLELRDHPIALNPFAPLADDADVDFVAAEIMGVFRLLLEEYWDSTLEAALRNVTMTLLSSRELRVLGERWWPALDEVAPLLLLEAVDDETKPWHKQRRTTYRETVWYAGLEEGDLTQAYQWFQTFDRLTPNPKARTAYAIISKLDRFLSIAAIRNMVCQEGSIDFRQVINEGKIVLVNLREESLGDMSSFLASVIMAKLLAAIYHQTELEASQRPPFAIFADEFHEYATESLLRLYQRGRKCGSTVFVAHTDRGWLRPWQRSRLENAQNTFCFNLAPTDAWEMARIFDATPRAGEDEFRPRYRELIKLDVPPEPEESVALTEFGQVRGTLAKMFNKKPVRPSDADKLRRWLRSLLHILSPVYEPSHLERPRSLLARLERGRYDVSDADLEDIDLFYDWVRRWPSVDGKSIRADGYIQDRTVYPDTPGTFHYNYPPDGGRGVSESSETGPVYDRVPGRARPYSDVYYEIGNKLCHQADYQARCKLAGLTGKPVEVVVQTGPLARENAGWREDIELFRDTAKQYGQPAEVVTQQLRRREELRRKALELAQVPGGDGQRAYEAETE